MMEFKCSIWSDYYNELSPETAIEKYIDAGFRYSELSINHTQKLLGRDGTPESIGADFRAFLKERGYTVSQAHLSFKKGLCAPDAVEDLKREIDLYLTIGIENAVIHANGGNELSEEERFARRVAALSELVQHIKGTPIRLCLENLGSVPETHTVERIRKMIDAVGSDQLKICLDTGHLHLVNGRGEATLSQVDFIRQAGKDLCAMHVTNNSGGGDDHLMPYSSRMGIDFKEVVCALREIGYEGLFNLEILGENKAPMYIREIKLDYIKKMVDYMTGKEFLK